LSTIEIIAEQNSPSDEKIIIHEVLIKIGDNVKTDQALFVAEGAKSLFDIVSPGMGKIVEVRINSGDFCEIGQVLAVVELA